MALSSDEARHYACAGGRVPCHQGPRGVSGAFVDVSGARNSPRRSSSALWIVAGILAVVFLVASSTKVFVPKEKLAGMGGAASRWVEDFSPGALKAIGALEFLAAVGLIVPAALGIAPVLVPLAATGAVLLFAGAVITRLRRGERATIIPDLVYLAMAAFVAWGRFGPGSFTRLTQRAAFSPRP